MELRQYLLFLLICFRVLRCSVDDLCAVQNETGEQVSQHVDVCTMESQSDVSHAAL